MQIFVMKPSGKPIAIDVQPTDTIRKLKDKIKEKIDADPSKQRLVFAGKQLMDDLKLQDYSINPNSTIFLVLRLKGGMKIFARVLTRKPITFEAEPSYRIERIQEDQQLSNFTRKHLENDNILQN